MAIVRSMKSNAGLSEDGAFALFFRPHPRGFDCSRVPIPGNFPSKPKRMLMPWGQPEGGWAQLELTDALGYSLQSSLYRFKADICCDMD